MIIDFVLEKPGRAHFMVSIDGVAYRKPMPPTKENLELALYLANALVKWTISQTAAKAT